MTDAERLSVTPPIQGRFEHGEAQLRMAGYWE